MLCLLNIRSLKKVGSSNSKACDLLSQDCTKYNIDICVVIETFLNSKVPDTYVWIEGFSIFRRDRSVCYCRKSDCDKQHSGGGILVYARASIEWEYHSVSTCVESFWIKLQSTNSYPIFINASYAPPNSTSLYICNLKQYIISVADEISRTSPNAILYITGDFNRMSLEDVELACCVTSLHSPPTRGDAHLDIVLSSRPDCIENVTCFTPKVETDHKAVLVTPIQKTKPVRSPQYFRLFSSRGRKQFQTLLECTNFNDVYSSDVNLAAELLDNHISKCFLESFPLRKVMMSDRDPAWLTPRAKWLILRKKRAKRRGRNRSVQKISEAIGAAKLRHFNLQSTKQWWHKMDSITHRKQEGKRINHKYFEPTSLNEQLAQRSSFSENESRGPAPLFDTTGHQYSRLTLSEVAHVLRTCKATSPGPNGIPHFVFCDFWRILAEHFLYVWNLSLQNGLFPQCYKKANIIPLPKVKNAKEIKHIRGISVTSIVARLFEKVIYRRWISTNILLRGDPLQFAYKKKLSTMDYLLVLQFLVLQSLDSSHVDGIHITAVDFSMAFDGVNQEMAAQQYEKFIDSPFISKWLYNFTVDRTQRLIWKDKPCEFLPIDRGCAQGTVCGPSVFSMLTDDISSLDPTCHLLKYSDDMTCIVPCYKAPTDSQMRILKEELDHFCSQAQFKGLHINYEKTKLMRFCLSFNRDCKCIPITQNIEVVSQLKILGVLFQSNCLFTKHIKQLLSRLRSLLYLFKDLQLKRVSMVERNQLFDALIISRLRYAISIYACDKNALKKIDNFLEKCFIKKYSITRISAYELLKTEDQRLVANILSNTRHPLRSVILQNTKTRTTRHNFLGRKPKTNTKIFHRSFCNRVLTL